MAKKVKNQAVVEKDKKEIEVVEPKILAQEENKPEVQVEEKTEEKSNEFDGISMTELMSYYTALKEVIKYNINLSESNKFYNTEIAEESMQKVNTLLKYETVMRSEMERRILDLKK